MQRRVGRCYAIGAVASVVFALIALYLVGGNSYRQTYGSWPSPNRLVAHLSGHFTGRTMHERGGSPRKRLMLAFRTALSEYEQAHGMLPSHPKGSEYALYLLRGFVHEDAEELLKYTAESWFDDDCKLLRNAPLLYINREDLTLSSVDPDVIILIETAEFGDGGQWICRADGGLSFCSVEAYTIGQNHAFDDSE